MERVVETTSFSSNDDTKKEKKIRRKISRLRKFFIFWEEAIRISFYILVIYLGSYYYSHNQIFVNGIANNISGIFQTYSKQGISIVKDFINNLNF